MSGPRGYLAPFTPRQRVHVRAVFFDLHATLAGFRPHFGPPDPEHVSRLLCDRGLSISPKAWKDALAQIHRLDYPRSEIGRPSRIYLKAHEEGGKIRVSVGGRVASVGVGKFG